MVESREEADRKARAAVELVERKLLLALDGESIRGMPDLGDRVYGIRVGVEGSQFAKLSPRTVGCLVLDQHGMLVIATMTGASAFVQRAPRGMIRASLFVPYMRAVRFALEAHLRQANRREAEFRRVRELAEKVAAAMM